MRQYIVLIGMLLSFALLSGCGNGNGKALTPYKRGLTSAQTANTGSTTTTTVAPALDYCKNFVGYDGTNGIPSAMFNGAQVCKITGTNAAVRIKVSANFPINGRFCIVPMASSAYRESCFSVNGQADVAIDATAQSYGYGSMAIIAEGDMAAYRAYLNMQSAVSPARGIAFMN